MYPVFFEQDSVSPMVLGMERTIISEEGKWHVAGAYFRDESVAATARRREAEKRVSAALRQAARLGLGECELCMSQILPGETTTNYAGKVTHSACAHEFDQWANSPATRAQEESVLYGITPEEEEAAA